LANILFRESQLNGHL